MIDRCSYAANQRCGDAMRERSVQAFEVPSARSPQTPPVVGVLTPYAFSSTPFDFQDWSLEITAEGVTAVSLIPIRTTSVPQSLDKLVRSACCKSSFGASGSILQRCPSFGGHNEAGLLCS